MKERLTSFLWLLAAWAAAGDPLDTSYWRTFQLNTIGVGTGGAAEYRQLLLAETGGIMPRHLKVGFAAADTALMAARGGTYDYLPSVFNLLSSVNGGRAHDLPVGVHLNAMPWNDSAQQAGDILHNFLEKYDGGALLQTDRAGRIRKASLAQDPTLDEEAGTFSPYLEMQLTLSPYAPLVQDYLLRNTRLAARYFAWLREEAPDVVTFCTLSSEFGMNTAANNDWCDTSVWSKEEFRDWLRGAGLYAGQGQYASLSAFNAAFAGATGFPWSGWDAVVPPVTVLWDSSANGTWWKKWHAFRVAQVHAIEQNQMRAARSAGWSPDRLFGHQIPGNPNSTSDTLSTLHASPWTTTFVQEGSGGITTYGGNASSATIFNAVYADDKNWGICEYNPLSASVASNLSALNAVWNAHAHLVCPYNWTQAGYAITNSAFLAALQQFVGDHSNDVYSGMAAYEAAPGSRDTLWTMSDPDDVEAVSGLTDLTFTNGVLSASVAGTPANVALALDESRHTLVSDAYTAASLRLYLGGAPAGPATLSWTDTNNVTASVPLDVRTGWNLCRVNLAEHAAWRERRVRALALTLPAGADALHLDWLQLGAGHCWHFDDPNEVYGVANFTGWSAAGGAFSGVSGADGYAYLATDKRSTDAHADRAFIDAGFYTKARVRLTSSATANGQLYWWTGDETPHAKSFPVSPGTQTCEIDLGADANWTGLVTRFRIDPVNASGVTCSVDYVSLAPVLLPPRAPTYETIANSPHPVFRWEPATEPDHAPLAYDFQLASDFGFTNVVFATVSQTPNHLTYIGPEPDGLHWWRVRARDGAGDVSPWMVPLPLFVRVWNGDTTNDFTSIHGWTDVVATNGAWTALTGFDPYFSLNTGNNNNAPGLNADLYKRVQMRLRVHKPGAPDTAQFFFFPKAGGTHSVNFGVPPDGEWVERTVDLSGHANWTGLMNSVRLDPTTASNATVSVDWVRFVPTGAYAPNEAPTLSLPAAQSNVTLVAGQTLTLTNSVADPNAPEQTLTFTLVDPPEGASIDADTGVLTWRPAVEPSPRVQPLVVAVTDNGVPSLSATQTVWVAVSRPAQPVIASAALAGGLFSLSVTGDAGPDYTLLASTNLTVWTPLWTTNPTAPPFLFSDPAATNFRRRFYRVLLGP